jgi:hypothetical protein
MRASVVLFASLGCFACRGTGGVTSPADAGFLSTTAGDAAPIGSSAGLPRTCEEAVSRLLATMKPDLRQKVHDTPKDELIFFHSNWGMGIRNAFGLWGENPELLASCAATRPGTAPEPDAVSQIIIEDVWTRLR